ncbi:hypothetical protein Plhal703r1_c15g0073041 [Plasmopara halstedii]
MATSISKDVIIEQDKEHLNDNESLLETHKSCDVELGDDTTVNETMTIAEQSVKVQDSLVEDFSHVNNVVVTEEDAAEIVEAIAKSIAVTQNREMDYSVAATVGSSIDGDSLKPEDFAGHETFEEESSKKAEVDFDELAAADDKLRNQSMETAEEFMNSVTTTKRSLIDNMSTGSPDEMEGIVEPTKAEEEKRTKILKTFSGEECQQFVTDSLSRRAENANSLVHKTNDAAPDTEGSEPESEKTPPSSKPHCPDSAAKVALTMPSSVQTNVDDVENHRDESLEPYQTPLATNLALDGTSPVKQVIHRLEVHEGDNSLDSLQIRTKRDYFTEKQRSISVSAEREKFQAQLARQTKEAAEAHDRQKSPAKNPIKRNSAMSSVRNMASRFEKKAEQSLDNLSFRTVRSFFPKEKSIHVDTEKQKFEALEKRQAANEEQMLNEIGGADSDDFGESGVKDSISEATGRRYTVGEDNSKVRGIASRFESKRAYSVVSAPVRTIDSFIVADSEASVRVSAEKAKYENKKTTSTPVKRTIDSFIVADSEASVRVLAEKAMFESQQKFSTPVKRTIDSFIVPESEASIRVSAEKAKFETPKKEVKTTKRTIDTFIIPESEASVRVSAEKERFENQAAMYAPTKRTIDTFIVAESEASVRVSAEKERFESLEKQSSGPVVRTIDTFIVAESEASVRVSAEKEKFESLEKQSSGPVVRTIDTFIVAESEASVRVSAEKEKFESLEKQSSGPVVRTIDTFIVPESEMSIRVAAEKAKLEALEKQKQKELEEQAAIESQKMERANVLAEEKMKLAAKEKARMEAEEEAGMEEEKKTRVERAKFEFEEEERARPEAREPSLLEADKKPQPVAQENARLEVEENEGEENVKLNEQLRSRAQAEEEPTMNATKVAERETEVAGVDAGNKTKLEAESKKKMENDEEEEKLKIEKEATELEDEEKTRLKGEEKNKSIAEVETANKKFNIEEENARFGAGTAHVVAENAQEEAEERLATLDMEEKEKLESDETARFELAMKHADKAEGKYEKGVADKAKFENVWSIKSSEEVENASQVVDIMEVTINKIVKGAEVVSTSEVTECPEVLVIDDTEVEVRNNDGEEKAQTPERIETHVVANDLMHQSPVRSSSFVEITVEHQTLADVVSTAQHTHWLSIPVNASPALTRLHTVLTDHNPLTAYALYPSSPTSPSSHATDDEELPVPTSASELSDNTK